MKKRIITFLLAVCLLLSFSACGATSSNAPGNDTGQSNKDSTANTTDKTDTAVSADDSWETPFPEPVTVTIALANQANTTFPEGDSMTDNIWTRTFKEKFNVIVKTEWVSDDYTTKMNLAIASQQLPDMFTVNNSQFKQLLDANLLSDLTNAYNKYASDGFKKFMDSEADIFATAQEDGLIYGIPQLFYGYVTNPMYIWIRKDWYSQIGGTGPKTFQDFENVMLTFMKKYGGYGLAVDKTLDYLMAVTPAFGAYYDIWLKTSDGSIQYSSIQPEMKDALATFADWYKKGILKKDFATMDYNAMMQDVVSGKAGVQMFYQWWGYGIGSDVISNNNDEAYFLPYELTAVDGNKIKYPVQFPNYAYSVVNKNCKHPEVLIKLISFYNYVNTDAVTDGALTIEEMSSYISGGLQHVTGPFMVQNPLAELDMMHQCQNALSTGDTTKFSSGSAMEKFNGIQLWTEKKDPAGIGYYLQMGDPQCAYILGEQVLNENRLMKSAIWGPSPDTLNKYGSTLKDLLIEGFTKIIMGVEPVDYFDTLVENWKAAGGDEVTQAVNLMYK